MIRQSIAPSQMRMRLFRAAHCPDCGGPIVRGEGFLTCPVCGYRRCYL